MPKRKTESSVRSRVRQTNDDEETETDQEDSCTGTPEENDEGDSAHEDGANKLLFWMPLRCTGALAGTKLIGHRPRTKNAIITLSRDLGPRFGDLEKLKRQGHWNVFLHKCRHLPGFVDRFYKDEDMAKWLEEHADKTNATFLGAGEEKNTSLRVVVHSAGTHGSKFLEMEQTDSSLVGNEEGYTPQELEDLVPRPDKAKGRHTLVNHLGGFRIQEKKKFDIKEMQARRGKCKVLLDLELGQELPNDVVAVDEKRFVVIGPKDEVGVFYESAPKRPAPFPSRNLGTVEKMIRKLTSGELKSLLQKLIRYGSSGVVCGDEEVYATHDVLQCVMEVAILHRGGFVPHIQSHVPGLVSLLKRLAVTIMEDAWVSDESGDDLQALLLAAAVAQADEDYFPTPEFVQRVFAIAHRALDSPRAAHWDFDRGRQVAPLNWKRGLSPLERASVLLEGLKSFEWDYWMFRDMCAEQRKHKKLPFEEEKTTRPDKMALPHFIDHHTAPHVAYHMTPRAVEIAAAQFQEKEWFGDLDKTKPYGPLFRLTFRGHTGINPRRKRKVPPNPEFEDIVQKAQSSLWMEQFGRDLLGVEDTTSLLVQEETNGANSLLLDDPEELAYELDPLVLGADIGHIQVKVAQKVGEKKKSGEKRQKHQVGYYVFVTQISDACVPEFGVVRIPTRGQKEEVIKAKYRKRAIEEAKRLLRTKGVVLPSHSLLGPGRTVVLQESDERLYFRKGQHLLEPPVFCATTTTVISTDEVMNRFQRASPACLRRLFRLTEGFVQRIEFPKITRFGGADNKPVHTIDIEVFQLCRSLSPMLFVLEKERFFRMVQPIEWYSIRRTCLEPLVRRHVDAAFDVSGWQFLDESKDTRILTEAQKRALESLKLRDADANLLVMDTGAGKTLVFLRYVMWLAQKGRLPPKVLFVTPKSAVDSIKREMQYITPNVEIRSMLKSKRDNGPLRSFWITILEHDHMRLVGDIWKDDLLDTLCCIDEFHKCLDQKTQRTKFMEVFGAGCNQRIGLSATPVIDNQIFGIKELLAPLCSFEITRNNFFVAYSHVVQEREPLRFDIRNIKVQMQVRRENEAYYALLPHTLGGENRKRLEASELYSLLQYAQDEALGQVVKLVKTFVSKGNCVFVVARNAKHVDQLAHAIQEAGVTNLYAVHKRSEAIVLTKETVATKEKHGGTTVYKRYDCVIVPITCECGFSMTICNVQIWSAVFPSNTASRHQMRGRIARLGSEYDKLTYVQIECGILHQLLLHRYETGDAFLAVLGDLNSGQTTF